jgi:hypothetical protein
MFLRKRNCYPERITWIRGMIGMSLIHDKNFKIARNLIDACA